MKIRLRCLPVVIAAFCIITSPLRAQEDQRKPGLPEAAVTPAPFGTGGGTAGMAQVAGYLCLLGGLLAGGFYLVKNGPALLQQRNKGPRKLVISETRMLGNRQFLVVAEYEEKKMLIGVCPGRIDYLCLLGGKDETFSSVLPEKPE